MTLTFVFLQRDLLFCFTLYNAPLLPAPCGSQSSITMTSVFFAFFSPSWGSAPEQSPSSLVSACGRARFSPTAAELPRTRVPRTPSLSTSFLTQWIEEKPSCRPGRKR